MGVLQDFAEYFTDPIPEEPEEANDEFEERTKQLRNDAKIFVNTQAYRDFRSMLKASINFCTPDPEKGTDVAGAMALKQAGLRESLEALDRVADRCEE